MNRLVLHVGLHKTGTTAIQRFLFNNRSHLHAQGVQYLATGIPEGRASWGQHGLAWALKRGGDPEGLWAQAKREANASAALVSSEEFAFVRQPKLFDPVLSAFSEWRIEVVCYLRRQDQMLESIYNHHVKACGETASIMEFAKRVWHRLEYAEFLKGILQVCGKNCLTVRAYERDAFRVDIFDDFLLSIGITDTAGFKKPQQVLNPGLSAEGLVAMLAANKGLQGLELDQARKKILAEHQSPPFSEHKVMTDYERRSLMDQFEDMNAEIAKDYLGCARLWHSGNA